MAKALLMQGNSACAEGAIAAGARFFAGYPITPSTEVAEMLAKRLPQVGGTFIQMEDEIAGMAATIGAALTGVKALTATSGPGFSLKQELIGYASMAEVPCVIVNVQRVGPSTGQPTSPAQADIMQARWGSHGDRGVIALSPSSVPECFTLTVEAFNLAEKYRTPVVLLMDEIVGHMREKIEIPDPASLKIVNRKKPTLPPGEFLPYKPDADGVPPMPAYGDGYRFHVTGLAHDYTGFPSGANSTSQELIARLHTKITDHIDDIVTYEEQNLDDAQVAVVAFGGTARTAYAAIEMARKEGVKAGLFRPITIWPSPQKQLTALAKKVKTIIVAELNYGQYVGEVERIVAGRANVVSLAKWNNEPITPAEMLAAIKEAN
ncbi:2-oxoacid:acceptor oxidoreductase subunit alpha [Sporomusa acidovorans]|uniref:2-oxoglutarate oxidoreductase subunit KorA n=1 Tax=Sporomusa acidovorans (strain ATCC 49682 / DSM 3132 / Mol) TaxID=1123286 RepID=A0ABZ3IWQ2_SPOA4|nr:2-oxoacid:acceptor oxidoreductase subunit alpha [Sporomusa acidovorans]OZC23604.1 2-oxoglutarate oxidoreductase subunit KorA [Sporomusa acidovorans DSM 3132]SDE22198.1 2-oxoglutarate ferredoxin oxidoreductase subunit alpha [Sporomusa acidovorans]